jgi:hypothetical protein
MSNIGRIIQDPFCNGFADREYDMNGAEIIAEGDCWIVAKKERTGECIFIDFQIIHMERDEKGMSIRVSHITYWPKQQYIDNWVNYVQE